MAAGATWFLYPPPSSEGERSPSVGEPVFVWLRSDRETGRGHVAAPADPSDPDRRLLISFDCDPSGALTHRTRPARLIPVFAPPPAAAAAAAAGAAAVGAAAAAAAGAAEAAEAAVANGGPRRAAVVCASTDTYRKLAQSQLTKADCVLEIGCSTGGATALLARHAGRVIGVDNSQWMVREARERNPGLRFEVVDALASPDDLASLATELASPGDAGVTAVFVDIGGNRQLAPLVTLLPWVEAELAPRLLVVKSEALAAAAEEHLASMLQQTAGMKEGKEGEHLQQQQQQQDQQQQEEEKQQQQEEGKRWPGQIPDAAPFWAALRARTAAGPLAANPLFYKAKAKGFKGIHPMKFPERSVPGADQRICRPHNYATCHAGEGCAFDHATCHHCLQPGHRAVDCTL